MQKSSTEFNLCRNAQPNNLLKKIAFGSMVLAMPFSSMAQSNYASLFPLVSIADHAKQDGFVQTFGINLEYAPAFDGSDEYGVEFQGGGALQYRTGNNVFFLEGFNIDGAELGWRSMISDNWIVQAGLRHETVLPKSDLREGKIEGLPHRGSAVFGFAEATYLFGKKSKYWLTGRLSAGPSDFGYRGKISAGYNLGRSSNGSGIDIVAYSTFGDEEQFDQFFGISASDSESSGLAQTDFDGGYRSSGVEIFYRQNLLKNMQVMASVGAEFYSSDIEQSPLVSEDAEITGGLSVVWRFW